MLQAHCYASFAEVIQSEAHQHVCNPFRKVFAQINSHQKHTQGSVMFCISLLAMTPQACGHMTVMIVEVMQSNVHQHHLQSMIHIFSSALRMVCSVTKGSIVTAADKVQNAIVCYVLIVRLMTDDRD